ncbi:MAG: oligosaccharide flippase family protein [Chloroflexi bacterium]|nr:oligosaccharide flippase family protein [Chloroflexota bacterium]
MPDTDVTEGETSPINTTPLAFRAVRSGLWMMTSSYWQIAFGFTANVFLTRLLDPIHYGEYALALFFASLLQLRTKISLSHAFGQHAKSDGVAIGTYWGLDVGLGLGGLLLALIATGILSLLGYSQQIGILVVLLVGIESLSSLTGIVGTYLEKSLNFKPGSVIQLFAFPLSYIPAFWFATHGLGQWSLISQAITGTLIAQIAGVTYCLIWLRPLLQMRWKFDWILARKFIRFGATIGMTQLLADLLTRFDDFLIGSIAGTASLGFYDRAYRTAQWPATLISGITARTAFYTYVQLGADRVRMQKTVRLLVWSVGLIGFPLALAVFTSAPDLIRLLYGERWLPSTIFLRFLILYAIARPIWEMAGSLFVAIGKPYLNTALVAVQLATLVITGIPLTLLSGAQGTTVAVGLAFVVGFLLIEKMARQELGITLFQELWLPGVGVVAVILAHVGLVRLLPLEDIQLWIRVIIKMFYSASLFLGLMLLFRPSVTISRLRYVVELIRQSTIRGMP